jgi:hypothetical protein
MGTGATRQILNIGLDAPRNPTILRRWLRNEVPAHAQVNRCQSALYTLGYINADLARHGNTLVVKLPVRLYDSWVYWLCNQMHQDSIAAVTQHVQEFLLVWRGSLVGPACKDYEPFDPAKFIGLPEDY